MKWHNLDAKLPETIFLYYEQDHEDGKGGHYMQVCPGRPRITVGDTKQFYCITNDVGVGGRVLFVPERGWVTTPSWPTL